MAVATALGVICEKLAIHYTVVRNGEPTVVDEGEIPVPASRTDRGDQLSWLLTEAEELLRRLEPDLIYVKKAGGQFAAGPERHEVEAVFQVAAHRQRVPCRMLTTEQIRASHLTKAKGAYESLLTRPDVKSRSNKNRREQYLYAITALGKRLDE